MKKKIFYTIFCWGLVLIFSIGLYAQNKENTFTVFQLNGSAMVKKVGDTKWNSLKYRDVFTPNDSLIVSKNTKISVLASQTGKVVSITGEKSLKSSDLLGSVYKSVGGFEGMINNAFGKMSSKTNRSGNIAGAVRGSEDLLYISPNKTKIAKGTIAFKFFYPKNSETAMISLSDENNTTKIFSAYIDKQETVSLPENILSKLEPGKKYYWSIADDPESGLSKLAYFELLDTKTQKNIEEKIAQIKDVFEFEEPLKYIMMGNLFEENGCFLDAVQSYVKAIKMDNSEISYQNLFHQVCDKLDFDREARAQFLK